MTKTKLKSLHIALSPDFQVHQELLNSLGYCLAKSSQLIKERFDQELEKYHIVTAQSGILTILMKEAPINQLDLGTKIGIDKATMVKLIDGLEELQYVERTVDENDRRAKLLTLTKEGKKLVKIIIEKRHEIEEDLLSEFNKKEREELRSYLSKMLIGFNRKRRVK